MRQNPFAGFNRRAEALGYPALLLVSLACLTLVVSGVGLLAVLRSGLAFGLAMTSLFVAITVLAVAIAATLGEPDDR